MKIKSAKAKGRRLQQKVVAALRAHFNLPEADVKSLPMGAQGADVWMSSAALAKFPFAIECKNVEKLNVWKAWEQAKSHIFLQDGDNGFQGKLYPALVFSRNNSEVLVTLRLDDLLRAMGNETKTKA